MKTLVKTPFVWVDFLGKLDSLRRVFFYYILSLCQNVTPINIHMIRAQKEIIWHLTCNNCKFYWTMATMDDKFCINRGEYYCPCCGSKQRAKEDE